MGLGINGGMPQSRITDDDTMHLFQSPMSARKVALTNELQNT